MTEKSNKQRLVWIDALRGLAMVFVIFGHQCQAFTEYFVFTSPIKIPLFFAITGYVFNDRNGDVKKFFTNLFWKLIIPWICLSLIPVKIIVGLFGIINKSPMDYFYAFISGDNLWYMPCCIIAETIHFFIRKYFHNQRRYATLILFMLIGLLVANFNTGNFANINTAFIAQGFMAIGLFIKEHIISQNKSKKIIYAASGTVIYLILGLITLHWFPGKCLDVHLNYYYDYFICGSMIFSGVISIFIISESIYSSQKNRFSGILPYIGRNTLVYYMLSKHVLTIFNKIVSILNITIKPEPIIWITNTVIMCIGSAIIAYLINTYLPVLVGKRKN